MVAFFISSFTFDSSLCPTLTFFSSRHWCKKYRVSKLNFFFGLPNTFGLPELVFPNSEVQTIQEITKSCHLFWFLVWTFFTCRVKTNPLIQYQVGIVTDTFLFFSFFANLLIALNVPVPVGSRKLNNADSGKYLYGWPWRIHVTMSRRQDGFCPCDVDFLVGLMRLKPSETRIIPRYIMTDLKRTDKKTNKQKIGRYPLILAFLLWQ